MATPNVAELRLQALAIFEAGVAAADPARAVQQYLRADAKQLSIRLNDGCLRTGSWSKIHLIAFGKAACAMAEAAQAIIPASLLTDSGLVVTNYENVQDIPGLDVMGAGHPLPDVAGLIAAKRIAERVRAARVGELVLVLVSGGGSALLPYPVASVSLQEKSDTTRLLLASGANINEINCVRKHLSQLKGGGLARLAPPADVHALVLSDVLGDELSAIASGPTVADDTCYADAVELLKNKGIWDKVPNSVQLHLQQGQLGLQQETPKANDPIFNTVGHSLIGGNTQSLQAMIAAAQRQSYQTECYSTQLCGEARQVAEQFVQAARRIDCPLALLAGGETTVTLQGNGLGGRNQEMALAFALAAQSQGLSGQWVFLSAGTDGRDGPTDAAGGLVDADSLWRMQALGMNPLAALDNNDAYHALQCSDDLVMTGATGTNVADLQLLLIDPHFNKTL
jgi:hydroxypyruvate reductase